MLEMTGTDYLVKNREEILIALYKKVFPIVAKYVSKMGGSFEEAKDVFQDAVIIYYENKMAKHLHVEVSETAYLLGISKKLWIKKYKENNKRVSLEYPTVNKEFEFIESEDTVPSSGRLMHFIEKAGNKCMELLQAFYYDQQSLNEIAASFGFSGVRSATVQKYKCLKKVREKVKEKSLIYDDFLN